MTRHPRDWTKAGRIQKQQRQELLPPEDLVAVLTLERRHSCISFILLSSLLTTMPLRKRKYGPFVLEDLDTKHLAAHQQEVLTEYAGGAAVAFV